MANVRNTEMKLPSFDELFSSQKERDEAKLKRIYEIPIEEIDQFPDHPYKVRKKEDGRYELISGHRRLRACQLLGIPTLKCDVLELTRDEACVLMVESNYQRSMILPSEKAFAYKMRLDAMKRLPGRPGKNVSPVGTQIRSDEQLSQEVGESRNQIQRYIRLTELIPDLLDMVDDGKIALRPAVELSYIPKIAQGEIWKSIEEEQCTPSHSQAIRMRRLSEIDKLTPATIKDILTEQKPNQKDKIVLRGDKFNCLFPPDLTVSKREDYIAAAMEYYGRHRMRQRERDDSR